MVYTDCNYWIKIGLNSFSLNWSNTSLIILFGSNLTILVLNLTITIHLNLIIENLKFKD